MTQQDPRRFRGRRRICGCSKGREGDHHHPEHEQCGASHGTHLLIPNSSPPSSQRSQRKPGFKVSDSERKQDPSVVPRRGDSGTPETGGYFFALFESFAVKQHVRHYTGFVRRKSSSVSFLPHQFRQPSHRRIHVEEYHLSKTFPLRWSCLRRTPGPLRAEWVRVARIHPETPTRYLIA